VKNHPLPRQHLGPAGVSLVELLIVLAIVGVISTGMYSLFVTTLDTYSDQAVNARMLQNTTSAMKAITQDLRSGGTFYAPACAGITGWPTAIASTSTASTLTIVTQLDDPTSRTELASSQPRSNATIGVVSVTGWANTNVGYVTDGVQCARFTVTGVVTSPAGLTHVPANDAYTTGSSAYTYPVATSMVYRVGTSQTITYDLDTSDPNITWLRRNNRRIAPDIQSLAFGYLDGSGAAVASPATGAANIRAVTVNLLVRGDKLDPSVRPNVAGGYRTQRLTSTVQLRNFGA
jgi:prepilin-type N-terminal cleavage/methylation domain-containing protein